MWLAIESSYLDLGSGGRRQRFGAGNLEFRSNEGSAREAGQPADQ